MRKGSEIKTVTVCGAGTIGSGFAAYFALKGLKTIVFEKEEAFLAQAEKNVRQVAEIYVKYGIAGNAEDVLKNISYTHDPEKAFANASFVQENCPEKIEIKREMIALMEKYLPEDAIISSSSTGMPAEMIAGEAKHPERILVSHPFNPSYLIPLVEICKSKWTEQKYVDATVEFFKACDKTPVLVLKDKPGFVANRLAHALWREEVALVTEGVCTLEDADNAVAYGPGLRWGIMGPALGYELGAGELGLGEMLRRYSASSNAIFADLSKFDETPSEFPNIAEEQMTELKKDLPEYVGHSIPEITAYRDGMLVELLKMHKKF